MDMVDETLKKQLDDFLEELDLFLYGGIGIAFPHPHEDEVKDRINNNNSPTYYKGVRDGVLLAKLYFKEIVKY